MPLAAVVRMYEGQRFGARYVHADFRLFSLFIGYLARYCNSVPPHDNIQDWTPNKKVRKIIISSVVILKLM